MQVTSLLREKEKRKERETQVQVIKWIIVCFGVLLYASYGRVCTWERKRVSKVFIYGICVFSKRNMIFFRLFSSNSNLHFLWLCIDVDMCQSMSIWKICACKKCYIYDECCPVSYHLPYCLQSRMRVNFLHHFTSQNVSSSVVASYRITFTAYTQ